MKGVVFVGIIVSLATVALGHGFGGDSSSGEDEGYSGPCRCSRAVGRGRVTPNPCANNTGTTNICGAGAQYLTCNDAVCSIANCSANQLWNQTQKACVSCSDDKHVAADYPKCVCNKGTTFNRSSRACVKCPTDATLQDDKCFCNATGNTPFFSVTEWACKTCPGQYVPYNLTRFNFETFTFEVITVQVCQCPGANDIFDIKSVSCVTCPANSIAKKARSPMGQDCCTCNIRGQYYNEATNTCACFGNNVLNAAGTSCVRPSQAASTVSPTPITP